MPTAVSPVASSNSATAPAADASAALAAREAALAAREARLAEQQAEFAAATAAAHAARIGTGVDAAIAAGRVLPAERPLLIALGTKISTADTLTFAAADGEEQTLPLLAQWDAFLAALPARVPLGEAAAGASAPAGGAAFAAPEGYAADRERLDLLGRINAYRAQHPGISFEDAAAAVAS